MSDDDSKSKYLPFNEGLPTKPDVDLLLASWPTPKVGDRFPYEVVEKLLGVPRISTRYHTVTNNWRLRLHERGFVVECDPGEAFYVATAEQISAATYVVLAGIGRKARKHRKKLAVAKVETDAMRVKVEHLARVVLAMEKDAKKHRMNLELPNTTITPLPQISAPKTKPTKADT